MPLKLVPPRPGRSPFWRVRGSYLGCRLDRTTGTADKALAAKFLAKWRGEIERGELQPGEASGPLSFARAALAYLREGGDGRFLARVVDHFGPSKRLDEITQEAIGLCAETLYPAASPATRNRQVYTPVSAVLKHAGVGAPLRRPKGAQGRVKIEWLWPEQAERLLASARAVDPEFAAFLTVLLYSGARLGDGLALRCDLLRLDEGFAFLPDTKSGAPRPLHLPPAAVAALASHPRGLDRAGRVFRFGKNGALYTLLKRAKVQTPDLRWVTFHTLRHTWATWMRRYAALDTRGLVGTGAWADEKSAARYAHVVPSEEARRADALPDVTAPTRAKSVQ